MVFRRISLLPISIAYGLVTMLRNLLFDMKVLREKSHDVTVISVGNLSMGGTGKTPHVEYLVRLLKDRFNIAVLLRGYGRKTKGFRLADEHTNAFLIGDEPNQYYQKFKDITVAVDGRRNRGVAKLREINPELNAIILDDAFQHRWIKPHFSIMLSDFHNIYYKDCVFPSGSLREFKMGARRADIIIITKTPVVVSPITRRSIKEEMKLKPYQKLLFSRIQYDGFISYKTLEKEPKPPKVSSIILFTGIANSYPLQDYLKQFCNELIVIDFPDHHFYKEKDIRLVLKVFDDQFTKNKILITTEKDVQRLNVSPKKDLLKDLPIFYVPIHISFHHDDEGDLKSSIDNLFRKTH